MNPTRRFETPPPPPKATPPPPLTTTTTAAAVLGPIDATNNNNNNNNNMAATPAIPVAFSVNRPRAKPGQAQAHGLPESAEVAGVVAALRAQAANNDKNNNNNLLHNSNNKNASEPLQSYQLSEVDMTSWPQDDPPYQCQKVLVLTLQACWTGLANNTATNPLDKKMLDDVNKKLGNWIQGGFPITKNTIQVWELLASLQIGIAHQEWTRTADALATLTKKHWDGNSLWITALRRITDLAKKYQVE